MKKIKLYNIASNRIKIMVLLFIPLFCIYGCKKYLDAKPNARYAIPDKVSDLQSLLDYYPNMNNKDVVAGEISSTDYFLTDANFNSLSSDYYKRMYVWAKDNLFAPASNDWGYTYQAIYVSNTVIESLKDISPSDDPVSWNNVKGQALVFRAKNFLQIASVWTLAYDQKTAQNVLGIPLKLDNDFNEKSVRSNLEETYQQIISDLKSAIPLLPIIPASVLRPSKPAAYGLLARVYLYMRDYQHAELYADSCLQLSSTLLDYNTLVGSSSYPIKKLNSEVIFESYIGAADPINNSRALIDTILYKQYSAADLRKTIFFKSMGNGYYAFKGSYEGSASLFSGLATDEMYLIRAESNARIGNTVDAMKDLNTLLKARYKNNNILLTAANSTEAINLILAERRKELLMRGIRWPDVKRLNAEGNNITLTRFNNGSNYNLSPNDLRFALPLPDDIIALSGMQQNPR